MSLGISPFGLVPFGLIPNNPTVVTYAYARPSSDVTDAGWVNESGNNTNLYDSINETSPSDSDYIVSSVGGVGSDECEVGLSSVSDPSTGNNHHVSYRYAKINVDGIPIIDLTVTLVEGTTIIATWFHHNIGTTLVTAVQNLTTGEANSISDYTNLRLRFNRTAVAFV